MRKNIVQFIRLSLVDGIGPILAKKLIAYCGGVEEVFAVERGKLLSIDGIGSHHADLILNASTLDLAHEMMAKMSKEDVIALSYLDKQYPARLASCEDAPLIVYRKGTGNLNPQHSISIVGTRTATDYGRTFTEEFIKEVMPYGPLIVSGLAHGIDVTAHKAAMKNGLDTVGVLAHGLDMIYPAINRPVAKKMLEHGGLLSEFPIGTKADKERFPMRNRIVAGMSDVTIVMESDVTGGSMITARMANEYHRDVFALPGRVHDKNSKGTNKLIRMNAAHLLSDVPEFITMMGWQLDSRKSPVQHSLFVELEAHEKNIVQVMSSEPRTVDIISLESKMPMSEVSSTLLQLEFKGLVRSLPGKQYVLEHA